MKMGLVRAAVAALVLVAVTGAASAEVYRVKVKYPWLPGSGAPPGAATLPDLVFLADCAQSPLGHDAAWIDRNCMRVAGVQYNPKELTVEQSVPWKK